MQKQIKQIIDGMDDNLFATADYSIVGRAGF